MLSIFVLLLLCQNVFGLVRLTQQEKQSLLDAHNFVRAENARGLSNQPPAANMMLMEWNDQLAQKAGNWASQCIVGHDQDDARLIPGYSWVNQNFAGYFTTNHSSQVVAWFNEYKYYDYDSQACSDVCGHYTQVSWAKTLMVGCAVSECQRYPYFLVCDYAYGGNFNNEKPYISGEACSQCKGDYTFCMEGLCASRDQCERAGARDCRCTLEASSCENGGVFNSGNCYCDCPSGYFGDRCQKKCENVEMYDYTCQNMIAPQLSLCGDGYDQYCPATCDACKTKLQVEKGPLIPRVHKA